MIFLQLTLTMSLVDIHLSSYTSMTCIEDSHYINSYDGYFNNVQSEYFMNGVVSSVHSNDNEDRIWRFRYCKPTGANPTWTFQFALLATEYDVYFSSYCGYYYGDSAMIGGTSSHDNDREDRQWTFHCGRLDTTKYLFSDADCYWTGYENSYDATFSSLCSDDGVIRAIQSEHDNDNEDRRWSFYCCRIQDVPTPYPSPHPTPSPTPRPTPHPTPSPTPSPSPAPTNAPTYAPTMTPTRAPTVPPTHQPTDAPIRAPTVPTISPTDAPTRSPTATPTRTPTLSPTHAPTVSPTRAPTFAPSLYAKLIDNKQGTTTRGISSLAITIFIMSAFLAFALVSLVDAKCLRRNDYFLVFNIVGAALDVCDTVLDILFALNLTLYFNETKSIQFLVAAIASYVFIIFPITYSIIQLVMKSRKWWETDDDIRSWWTDNSKVLYLLSICTGSSYTAVEIVNCNAFQLDVFTMGLKKPQRIQFNTKRVYGIVLCENIPQVGIQIWYLTTVGLDLTALLSIIFSLISIVTATLTICTQKTLIRNQEFEKISFHISGEEIVPSVSTKIKGIKSKIALLLGISRVKLIEIPRAKLVSGGTGGLKFEIYLFINNIESNDLDYAKVMKEALENGKLMHIFQEEWDLTATVNISNLEFEYIESRIQQKESELRKLKRDNVEYRGVVRDTFDTDSEGHGEGHGEGE
eukprot:131332_1